jgi:hypothetical protein
MAIENPHVTAAIFEANEFPDLIDRYAVSGVPKIVVNEQAEFVGALPEHLFVPQVLQQPPEPRVGEPISER